MIDMRGCRLRRIRVAESPLRGRMIDVVQQFMIRMSDIPKGVYVRRHACVVLCLCLELRLAARWVSRHASRNCVVRHDHLMEHHLRGGWPAPYASGVWHAGLGPSYRRWPV